MKCVKMVKGLLKGRWIFSAIGFMVTIIVITIIFFQKAGHEEPTSSVEQIENNREEIYVEFEKIYRESEDEWNKVIEEIKNEEIYEQGVELYVFNFKKTQYPKKDNLIKRYYFDEGRLKGDDERILKIFSTNEIFINALEEIDHKGIVYGIVVCPEKNMLTVEFEIKTEYTPFVKDNNGVMNSIVYCEDKDCERFGYHKIDRNWYVYITPRPE